MVAQEAAIRADHASQMREAVTKYGAPVVADEGGEQAAAAVTSSAVKGAQDTVKQAEKKLAAFERLDKARPVKSADKLLERSRMRAQLQDELTQAREQLTRTTDPVEDLIARRAEAAQNYSRQQAAFEEQQKMFGGRIPAGAAPKPLPVRASEAKACIISRLSFCAAGPVPVIEPFASSVPNTRAMSPVCGAPRSGFTGD